MGRVKVNPFTGELEISSEIQYLEFYAVKHGITITGPTAQSNDPKKIYFSPEYNTFCYLEGEVYHKEWPGSALYKQEGELPLGNHYIDADGTKYGVDKDGLLELEASLQGLMPKTRHITYRELAEMKKNAKLVPGMKYRITDYEAIPYNENTNGDFYLTSQQSAFDIIVTALSVDAFDDNVSVAPRENAIFPLTNLISAWKVKYCFDNAVDRFAWANKGYGTGVIYYMKDEFGNEAPYDFKNILFVFTADIRQAGIKAEEPYYTFNHNNGSDISILGGARNNTIKPYYGPHRIQNITPIILFGESEGNIIDELSGHIFIGPISVENHIGKGCGKIILGGRNFGNVFHSENTNINIGQNSNYNIFYQGASNLNLGASWKSNVYEANSGGISIFDNSGGNVAYGCCNNHFEAGVQCRNIYLKSTPTDVLPFMNLRIKRGVLNGEPAKPIDLYVDNTGGYKSATLCLDFQGREVLQYNSMSLPAPEADNLYNTCVPVLEPTSLGWKRLSEIIRAYKNVEFFDGKITEEVSILSASAVRFDSIVYVARMKVFCALAGETLFAYWRTPESRSEDYNQYPTEENANPVARMDKIFEHMQDGFRFLFDGNELIKQE